MKQKTVSGKCLCGAVEIEAKLAKEAMGACHCRMCRQWGGGPMLTVDCGQDVSIKGENNVGRFESSEWAVRGFCTKCGTHLFYQINANGQMFVPAGFFNEADDLHFDHQIFIDQKPDNYSFANDTHNMTGEEAFAAFTPQESE